VVSNMQLRLMQQPMSVVYKYVSQDAARKIIANGSVRFGRPSGMNDPFDVYLDDLFNLTVEQLQAKAVSELLDLLRTNPSQFQNFVGADPTEVDRVVSIMNSIPPHELPAHCSAIAAALFKERDEAFAEMSRSLEIERQQIVAQFENTALFCITRSRDNLLMWAHYADSTSRRRAWISCRHRTRIFLDDSKAGAIFRQTASVLSELGREDRC